MKKGIDKACEFLIKKLRENSKPVKGTEDIRVSSAPKGQPSGYVRALHCTVNDDQQATHGGGSSQVLHCTLCCGPLIKTNKQLLAEVYCLARCDLLCSDSF